MSAFILTWASDQWDYKPGERDRLVDLTLAGEHPTGSWSVGNRRSGIHPGDRLFQLKQRDDRGIVASGYAISEVYQDAHWDGSGRPANYVLGAWDTVLPISERVEIDELKLAVPGVSWDRLQASGVGIDEESEERLEALWTRVTGRHARRFGAADPDRIQAERSIEQVVSPASRGQKRSQDARHRQAVEKRAMRVAARHFERAGWAVVDVSSNRPYDLECTLGNERRLVEVKGTTGQGESILLTANEVRLAQESDHTVLVVVTNISVRESEKGFVGSGGDIRVVEPWTPHKRHLEATAYRYWL